MIAHSTNLSSYLSSRLLEVETVTVFITWGPATAAAYAATIWRSDVILRPLGPVLRGLAGHELAAL